ARDRRRVGLGQERHRDDAHGADARRERGRRGRGALQGQGPADGLGPRNAEPSRQRGRHEPPGPDDLAEPRRPDRRADRRGVPDEIIVMYAGRVVERGSKRDVFYDPQMPYTWGLLGSIPRLDRPRVERLHTIEGAPPSLINLPEGCKFRPRCPHAFEKCKEEPGLENRVGTPGHLDRCWL